LLDEIHPDLASLDGDLWVDTWVFFAGRTAVKTVLVGGEVIVDAGRHKLPASH